MLLQIMNVQTEKMPSLRATWLSRHRRRITEVGIGHTLYATFNWFFDNILYIYVIYRLGLITGGALMTLLSLLQCAATLMLYERMRIDWVGAGYIATLKHITNPTGWQRIILRCQQSGAVAVFFALCIFSDPFITTAYFREGRFDGLSGRDWKIFIASGFASNFYCSLRSGAIAAVLLTAFQWVDRS